MLKMRTFRLEQYSYEIVSLEKLKPPTFRKANNYVDLVLSRVSLETLLMLKMRTFRLEQYSYDCPIRKAKTMYF
jgi:hypothetical protein